MSGGDDRLDGYYGATTERYYFVFAGLSSDDSAHGASPVVHEESAEVVLACIEAGGTVGGAVVIEFVICE